MSQELDQTVGLYRSSESRAELGRAVGRGEVPVAVYSLGKMGLPLAAVFAEVTGETVGVDIDPAVVDAVADGHCPVQGEPNLPTVVANQVDRGALTATTDAVAAAEDARVRVVIVPTLVEDGSPDLSNVTDVAQVVAEGLSPGDLVWIKSTVLPTTARAVVEPLLTDAGPCAREEFGVAVCPERPASGRALRDIRGAYPRSSAGPTMRRRPRRRCCTRRSPTTGSSRSRTR